MASDVLFSQRNYRRAGVKKGVFAGPERMLGRVGSRVEIDWPNTLFQAFVVAWVLIAYGVGAVVLAWSDRVGSKWNTGRVWAEGGVYVFVGIVMAIMLMPTGGDDPSRAWIPSITCLVITSIGIVVWTLTRTRVHRRNRSAINQSTSAAVS